MPSTPSSMTAEEHRLAEDLGLGLLVPIWNSAPNTGEQTNAPLYSLGSNNTLIHPLTNQPWMPRNQQMHAFWNPQPHQVAYQPRYSMGQNYYPSIHENNRDQSSWRAPNHGFTCGGANIRSFLASNRKVENMFSGRGQYYNPAIHSPFSQEPVTSFQCAHANRYRGLLGQSTDSHQGLFGMEGLHGAASQFINYNDGADQSIHPDVFCFGAAAGINANSTANDQPMHQEVCSFGGLFNSNCTANTASLSATSPSRNMFNHAQDYRNSDMATSFIGHNAGIPSQGTFCQNHNHQSSGYLMMPYDTNYDLNYDTSYDTNYDTNSGALSQCTYNPQNFQNRVVPAPAPAALPDILSAPPPNGVDRLSPHPLSSPATSSLSTLSSCTSPLCEELRDLGVAIEAQRAICNRNRIADITFGTIDMTQSFENFSLLDTGLEDGLAQNEPANHGSFRSMLQTTAETKEQHNRVNMAIAQATQSRMTSPRELCERALTPNGIPPAENNLLGRNSANRGYATAQRFGNGCGHNHQGGNGRAGAGQYVPQRSRTDMSHITCHFCGEQGHKMNACLRKKALLRTSNGDQTDNRIVHAQQQLNAATNCAAGDKRGNGNAFRRPKSYGPPAMSLSDVAAVKCQNTAHTE